MKISRAGLITWWLALLLTLAGCFEGLPYPVRMRGGEDVIADWTASEATDALDVSSVETSIPRDIALDRLSDMDEAQGDSGVTDANVSTDTGSDRGMDVATDQISDIASVPDISLICTSPQIACGATCVDIESSIAHCGACNRACSAPQNATSRCVRGVCEFICNPGFDECDRNPMNGCETNLTNSMSNCARCNNQCSDGRPNSATSCIGGSCVLVCRAGFLDCDGLEANGCEVDTRSNPAHCGGCFRACPIRPQSVTVCSAGTCGFSCVAPFLDCDRVAVNGCEQDTGSSSSNCGACGASCSGTDRYCNGGRCDTIAPGCEGFSLCSRCSRSDPLACSVYGRCDGACSAGMTCDNGRCRCPAGQVQCGTECVSTSNDSRHCGRCGMACAAGEPCIAGQCGCPAGRTLCGGACVDLRRDLQNCGECAHPCLFCESAMCRCGDRGRECCGVDSCASGLRCVAGRCQP